MNGDKVIGDLLVMVVSLTFVIASVVAISLKEKSWINWYSLLSLQTIGMLYVLPAIFMLNFGPSGSFYAYAYCYATYALMSLCSAVGYCCLRPMRLRHTIMSANRNGAGPWVLLVIGLVLYLPVMGAFSKSLLRPREIYAGFSAAGYGINFFGSAVLITLGFVVYLFKRKKNLVAATFFFVASALLIYLHGSKGQLIVFTFIGALYKVYVRRRRASFTVAIAAVASITLLAGLLFAVFGNSDDLASLAMDMANYSDSGRNAMTVIDDSRLTLYQGQLELEDEIYSRMPHLLIPDKPRVFGQVRLAQRYYPEWFRDSAGTPSFGIGMQYADFGPVSLLFLCMGALGTAWLARSVVVAMQTNTTPGRFLLLLFFAGVSILPLGAGYLLPETILLAIAVDWFQANAFVVIKRGTPAAGIITAESTG